VGSARRRPARRRGAILAALLCITTAAATEARADAADVLQWIPADTRVVIDLQPGASTRQPRAREALGVDALLGATPARRRLAQAAELVTVAFVPVDGSPVPVVFARSAGGLEKLFAELRGESLGRVGAYELHRGASAPSSAVALLSPRCVVEGGPAAVRSVLGQAAGRRDLDDLPPDGAPRRLFAMAPGGAPVTLLYLARDGGADLYAICKDLELVLRADLGAALDSYEVPLRMLGTTQGLRLDLHQDRGDEIASVLHLAMPNRMAAQLAQVSLSAGRDLVRMASEAAVKAHTLTATDARLLDAVLGTLQASANGDVVRVQVRLADPAQLGER
jgi:hypothetical protein